MQGRSYVLDAFVGQGIAVYVCRMDGIIRGYTSFGEGRPFSRQRHDIFCREFYRRQLDMEVTIRESVLAMGEGTTILAAWCAVVEGLIKDG